MSSPIIGAVFDLDGTLTEPGAIDFARMRERIGMPESGSILHWIEENAAGPRERQQMQAVIAEEESFGLEHMRLGAGFAELVDALTVRGETLRTGICTRNSVDALSAFDALLRGSGHPPSAELFHVQLARDQHSEFLGRVIENKPSHEPVHEVVRLWGLDERFAPLVAHEHDPPSYEELMLFGDNLDDCLAGRRAGVRTGLVLHGATLAKNDPIHRAVDVLHGDLADVASTLSRQ